MRRLAIVLALFVITLNSLICPVQAADDSDGYFILCHPESFLNARFSPSKHGSMIGQLYCGDYVETDGKKKNGFAHCINLSFETPDGWISTGYMVETEPVIEQFTATVEANGRVACREKIGGKVVRWVKPGSEVTVFAYTDEWSVTNKGYIRTEYLQASTTTEKSMSME